MHHIRFVIMISKTIGDRLKHARTRAKLTQDQLAKRCHVTRSLISQWESGTVQGKGIEAANLSAAARALGVSVDYLLTGEDAPAVAEDRVAYAAVPDDLAALWPKLTKAQQAALITQAQALADTNATILSELSGR